MPINGTMSVEEIYENLKPPPPEDDVYDMPTEDEIRASIKPAVNRNSKPAINKKPVHKPPIQSHKPDNLGPSLPVRNKSVNIPQSVEQPPQQTSIADRKAMFQNGNVPSPFRTKSSKFGQQTYPQFGSSRTTPAQIHNNSNNGNNIVNINNNNNTFLNQQGINHAADTNALNTNNEEIYEFNDEDEEGYDFPEHQENMYITPKDETSPQQYDTPPNARPLRNLPRVPTDGANVTPSEFLNRISTINKLKQTKQQLNLPIEEDTYDVCDGESFEKQINDRQRMDSNSSRTSSSSNQSGSSSRENSFRMNHPRTSPMENRPLPTRPEEAPEEEYEVVNPVEIDSIHGLGNRPPMPLPNGHTGNTIKKPVAPPVKGRNRSLDLPRKMSITEPESYNYCEEILSSAFPAPRKNNQGITIPDDDEYEMPESMAPITSPRKINESCDVPPLLPVRSDDPKRISPPSPPPKGQKAFSGGDLPKQTLAASPMLNQLRMQKPRHSDVGLEQGARKRLEMTILKNGWLTGLEFPQSQDIEKIERMRNKLYHQLQIPRRKKARRKWKFFDLPFRSFKKRNDTMGSSSVPVLEKGRSESDAITTVAANKRPVPVPPVGQKPKPLLPTGQKPLPYGQKPSIITSQKTISSAPDFPVVPLEVLQRSPPTTHKSSQSQSQQPQAQQQPFKPSGAQTLPNKPVAAFQPPSPNMFGNFLSQRSRSSAEPVNDRLESNSWYQGKIDRHVAERKLRVKNKDGTFIIRDTDKGSGYSITILYDNTATNLRVPLKDGHYFLGSSPQGFPSVPALVRHFLNNKIQLASGGEIPSLNI